MPHLPRYPVYVISKGRADRCLTARFLRKDGVPHRVVVEPQEAAEYAAVLGAEGLLQLPFSNLGLGSIPARNWVWEHAKASGAVRHWILDDNIRRVRRLHQGKRLVCPSGPALAAVEDFVDRYENVAIAGLNYSSFVVSHGKILQGGLATRDPLPFYWNTHVYSCILIRNDLQQRWRGRYNEDTDLCLQVLSAGLCTILVNAFCVEKMQTMTMRGGNTAELYRGDGRLRMARALERRWPGVVTVKRRFGRPQHVVFDSWKRFGTVPRLRPGVVVPDRPDEYGLRLKGEVARRRATSVADEQQDRGGGG